MKNFVKKVITIVTIILSTVEFSISIPFGPINLDFSLNRSALVFF